MTAHEWILWPGLLLASGIGAGVVGRRLDTTRRTALVMASALMVVPAGYTAEFLASQESFLTVDQLRRYSAVAALALLALWGLTEVIVVTGLWERIARPFRRGATVLVGLVLAVGLVWLLAAGARLELREGSFPFRLALYSSFAAWIGTLSAPALASLLPLSLAWPGDSADASMSLRLLGTAVLLPLLVVPAAVGLAGQDVEVEEEIPREAVDGHEAVVTIWIDISPGLNSGSDPGDARSKNLTIPLPAANGTPSTSEAKVLEELRDELRREATGRYVSVEASTDRVLELELEGPVQLAADVHGREETILEGVKRLHLASKVATAEDPEDVRIHVRGSLCWTPVHHRAFERSLHIRAPGEATVGEDPVPFRRAPSHQCTFIRPG